MAVYLVYRPENLTILSWRKIRKTITDVRAYSEGSVHSTYAPRGTQPWEWLKAAEKMSERGADDEGGPTRDLHFLSTSISRAGGMSQHVLGVFVNPSGI